MADGYIGMDKKECFECCFLDVGQGSSSVIYLGDGEAIVIDCGPGRSKETLKFLKRYVSNIKALIFSHNDSDHINGASGVLAEYKGMIEWIYILDDGKYEKIIAILESWDPEDRPKALRTEYGADGRGIIFDESEIKIEIIYPSMHANVSAQKAGSRRANQTSAIIKLTCGQKCVVFSGDATIEAWEYLSNIYLQEKPFECDVMTIPHHGGRITSGSEEYETQKRLYSQIIKPKYGIISVGTANPYNHPCFEGISAMIESGVEVLCTQMTAKCCDDLEEIRGVNRIITQPSLSSRKEDRTKSGKSRNVACVGTITAEITPDEIKINQLDRHRRNIEFFSKISSFKSLCGKHNLRN